MVVKLSSYTTVFMSLIVYRTSLNKLSKQSEKYINRVLYKESSTHLKGFYFENWVSGFELNYVVHGSILYLSDG